MQGMPDAMVAGHASCHAAARGWAGQRASSGAAHLRRLCGVQQQPSVQARMFARLQQHRAVLGGWRVRSYPVKVGGDGPGPREHTIVRAEGAQCDEGRRQVLQGPPPSRPRRVPSRAVLCCRQRSPVSDADRWRR